MTFTPALLHLVVIFDIGIKGGFTLTASRALILPSPYLKKFIESEKKEELIFFLCLTSVKGFNPAGNSLAYVT